MCSEAFPAATPERGDGNRQHVVFSNDLSVEGSASLPMKYTDHDAWLVELGTT